LDDDLGFREFREVTVRRMRISRRGVDGEVDDGGWRNDGMRASDGEESGIGLRPANGDHGHLGR
jgi:hypothetical protein